MTDSYNSPETHAKYRPPVDMPQLELDQSPRSCIRNNDAVGREITHAFVAQNLLSSSECAQIIEVAEQDGLEKVNWEYSPEYRDCSRVVMRSKQLANELYKRLVPLLSRKECEQVRPFGFDHEGDWRPLKLNEVVRISRYDDGGHFQPHCDGAFVENDDVRSVYTVLVYLNQAPAFQGGSTRLFLNSNQDVCGASSCENGHDVEVHPQTGSALVMTHDTLHSGQPVTFGTKYIARFDLMFHRLGGSMTEHELNQLPDRVLAEQLYASSIQKQRDGDPQGSTQDYVKALKLQAKLPSCTPQENVDATAFGNLGEDLMVQCIRFLEIKDIAQLSAVSRAVRSVCSNGILWRELFLLRWPTLGGAEATVLRDVDEANEMPSTDPPNQTNERPPAVVYIAQLSEKPNLDPTSQEKLGSELYSQPPTVGYGFSSLQMASFTPQERPRDYRWKRCFANVSKGKLQFAEYNQAIFEASQSRWAKKKNEIYDESKDSNMALPEPVPLNGNENVWFAFGESQSSYYYQPQVDCCIVPNGNFRYLAVCMNDPRISSGSKRYFGGGNMFSGIMNDIARVLVIRQTEHALKFGDSLVKCDSKTKQWKTAYARRHYAERFFDVVTIDIGSNRTKFACQANVDDMLQNRHSFRGMRGLGGVASNQLDDINSFFFAVARKYQPSLVPRNALEFRNFLSQLGKDGNGSRLVEMAMADNDLASTMPPAIVEARYGCGSLLSLVKRHYGHLWSAGRGLQNHEVGEMCLTSQTFHSDRGPHGPFDGEVVDTNVMGIITAYVVEYTYMQRPKRKDWDRRTCAEHPINIVEPVLGFSQQVKMQLVDSLSSWHVPFVGFVNGAVAALMCGDAPRQNGIVVMLGGQNSAVVNVVDGVADVANGIRLPSCNVDDACAAIQHLVDSFYTDKQVSSSSLPHVLVTGGRATDFMVDTIRERTKGAHIYTASLERERYLDAVRGANILANLSDGRKHFKSVFNSMWTLN